MATLGSEFLQHEFGFTELVELQSFKLLKHALLFNHVYMPDTDLLVYVNQIYNVLNSGTGRSKVSYDQALCLTFICFAVSEIKFRESEPTPMSPLCQYIWAKSKPMMEGTTLRNLSSELESITADESRLVRSAADLALLQETTDPTKSVLTALSRFRLVQLRPVEARGGMDVVGLMTVPATSAVDNLGQAAPDQEVSFTVGWILMSLWLSGETQCPDMLYWLSPYYRRAIAGSLGERLAAHPAMANYGGFDSGFFVRVVDAFPLFLERGKDLVRVLNAGRPRSPSRGQSPIGDENSYPNSPIEVTVPFVAMYDMSDITPGAYDPSGYNTPGEDHEATAESTNKAYRRFLGTLVRRYELTNKVGAQQKAFIGKIREDGIRTGRDYVPFDDEDEEDQGWR